MMDRGNTNARPDRRRWVRPLVVSGALVAAFAIGAQPLQRPDPRPADVPRDEFSAERAMADVAAIAREPHPVGSPEMAAVADRISSRLNAAGVEIVERAVREEGGGVTLHNTIGRIAGTQPTGTVLFVSHPDSVRWGPGAGDNATGAATMLEVARAIAAGPPPRNDILFLFDDGEEGAPGAGYFLGGRAFADGDPLMDEVRLVVGMDTAAWGPAHVLQSRDRNGAVIRGYADGVAEPLAFGVRASLEDGEFETLPFRERGLPAIELEDTYADNDQHTSADTVAGVEPASVQQLGDQALGLAHAYGDMDLDEASAPERAFHTFPQIGVVHYPAAWSLPLALVGLALFVVVAIVATRRRMSSRRRLAAGLGAATLLFLGVLALCGIGEAVYEALYPNPSPHPVEEYLLPSSAPFAIGVAVVAAVLLGLAYRRLAGRLGTAALGLGFLGLWAMIGLAFTAIVPAAGYIFNWPLIAACAAWLWVLHRPRADLLLVVPAAVAALLFAPILLLGFWGAGLTELWAQAIVPALTAGLVAAAVTGVEPRTGPTAEEKAGGARVSPAGLRP